MTALNCRKANLLSLLDLTCATMAMTCIDVESATITAAKRKASDPVAFALQVKRLSPHAVVPKRGSPLAAGYDLYSAHDVTVPAEGKALVKTDLAIAVPDGCYGRVGRGLCLHFVSHSERCTSNVIYSVCVCVRMCICFAIYSSNI